MTTVKYFGFLEYFRLSKTIQFPLVRKKNNNKDKSEEPTIDVLLVKVFVTNNIHYFSRIRYQSDLFSVQKQATSCKTIL